MNIVSCAMLAAFILSMPERPDVERLREYYERSMMTPACAFIAARAAAGRIRRNTATA